MKLLFKLILLGWVIMNNSCKDSLNKNAHADITVQDVTALYQWPKNCEDGISCKQSGNSKVFKMWNRE